MPTGLKSRHVGGSAVRRVGRRAEGVNSLPQGDAQAWWDPAAHGPEGARGVSVLMACVCACEAARAGAGGLGVPWRRGEAPRSLKLVYQLAGSQPRLSQTIRFARARGTGSTRTPLAVGGGRRTHSLWHIIVTLPLAPRSCYVCFLRGRPEPAARAWAFWGFGSLLLHSEALGPIGGVSAAVRRGSGPGACKER